jgi:hypothetical protein
MLAKLKQIFRRIQSTFDARPQDDDEDGSWLCPPADPLDVAGWDQYWLRHVEDGIGPPLLDMFCDDSILIEVMRDQGMKSILCAGNGISQEPKALAAAGMEVVALDISPLAVEIAKSYEFPSEAVSHYYEAGLQRPGGKVEFVTGDILDFTVCPGPFDVIIERLTVQNYFTHDMGSVLNILAKRLSEDGIFISHCHDGAWKPPAKPRHYTESWFREAGWAIWSGGSGRKPPGRVAWFLSSTG